MGDLVTFTDQRFSRRQRNVGGIRLRYLGAVSRGGGAVQRLLPEIRPDAHSGVVGRNQARQLIEIEAEKFGREEHSRPFRRQGQVARGKTIQLDVSALARSSCEAAVKREADRPRDEHGVVEPRDLVSQLGALYAHSEQSAV